MPSLHIRVCVNGAPRLPQAGADHSAPRSDAGGWTPLLAAAHRGHLAVVEVLLAANASVLASKSDTGASALFYAAKGGHAEVVTVCCLVLSIVGEIDAVGTRLTSY